MKLLIVGKPKSDQFDRLKQEAENRGHEVLNCSSSDLYIKAFKNNFEPVINDTNLSDIDLIYLLIVGSKMWEWYVTCDYLHSKFNTKIVEYKYIDPTYNVYFSSTAELLKETQNNIPLPKTIVLLHKKNIENALEDFEFPVILKASGGQRGTAIEKCSSVKDIEGFFEKFFDSKSYMIREFIPNDGDIRVFTVGYRAIGAMKRTPEEGEFRSNISQGGVGSEFDLDANPKIRELAEKMSELNHTEIAGVDIIINKETGEPYVLEVNRGPQFQGFEKFTETNAALEIVKYLESK